MSSELGSWLRGQREARGWSRADMARRLITAAREAGEDAASSPENLRHSIYRWERGLSGISGPHQRLICRAFDIVPGGLGHLAAAEHLLGGIDQMSGFGSELERWMRERGMGVRELHRRSGYSAAYISQLQQGRRNPKADTAQDLDDALGAGGALAAAASARSVPSAVQRRAVIGLTGASIFGAALEGVPRTDTSALATALTALGATDAYEQPGHIDVLAAATDRVREHYQDCRYTQLTGELPALVQQLNVACSSFGGDARDRAHALSADAHHVAASMTLKHGDLGLAALAADRSMRAAIASGDPVAIASSARIVTHALMNGGHLQTAVTTATSHAIRLDHNLPDSTPDSLSVYGSLLLRGAIAASLDDNRPTAHELLAEAEDSARRLGHDANHRWTAFGPVNASLHRISVAVTLGDAGTAFDVARGINPAAITVTERKATLFIDTARAFMQRGRHENAYLSIRAAHEVAPEEVTGRTAVRTLVRDLVATAPPTIRRDAAEFAASIGAVE